MNFPLISNDDFIEFTNKFPSAYHFLLIKSLEGEKRMLTNEVNKSYVRNGRRQWIENRLSELKDV